MDKAPRMITFKAALLWTILLLGCAAAAQAGDLTLTKTMALTTPATDWNTTGFWSDSNGAHSGADYWVGIDRSGAATGGTTMRTPSPPADIAAGTFPGDSLHIGTGGSMTFKPTGSNTFTFPNLFMTDGSLFSQGTDNTTATINGKITLSGTTKLNGASPGPRKFIVNSQLVGNGILQFNMDYTNNNNVDMLNNNTSTFNGAMEQYGGTVKLLSATPLGAATTYSIKTSTNGAGTLDPDVDVNCVGTDLVMSATSKIQLDQKMIFKSVNVNGTALTPGYYTAAALQASYATYFTNSGGVLIVGTPTPQIAVNPTGTTVTFSSLNVLIQAGDKATQTVTVTNNGSADVTFTKQGSETNQGLVMSGSAFYKIKSVSQATNLPLTPGSVLTITLEFSGVTQADYVQGGNNTKTGKLSIFSNASGQARYDIGLTGATTVPVELSTFSAQ